MLLSIVIVLHDAEKLKYFSFAASLQKRVAGDVGKKNAYHIWFAATDRQGKRDKCESAFRGTSRALIYKKPGVAQSTTIFLIWHDNLGTL